MKKEIIILCAVLALAGCSPKGGTGTGSIEDTTPSTNRSGGTTGGTSTNTNTNRFGTDQNQGGTGTGEQTQPPGTGAGTGAGTSPQGSGTQP